MLFCSSIWPIFSINIIDERYYVPTLFTCATLFTYIGETVTSRPKINNSFVLVNLFECIYMLDFIHFQLLCGLGYPRIWLSTWCHPILQIIRSIMYIFINKVWTIVPHFSYKHALDGLLRVYREEGFRRLFGGASPATSRAVFMTIGQLSFYDQVKLTLLGSGYFTDNMTTHFLSSLTAVSAT